MALIVALEAAYDGAIAQVDVKDLLLLYEDVSDGH